MQDTTRPLRPERMIVQAASDVMRTIVPQQVEKVTGALIPGIKIKFDPTQKNCFDSAKCPYTNNPEALDKIWEVLYAERHSFKFLTAAEYDSLFDVDARNLVVAKVITMAQETPDKLKDVLTKHEVTLLASSKVQLTNPKGAPNAGVIPVKVSAGFRTVSDMEPQSPPKLEVPDVDPPSKSDKKK